MFDIKALITWLTPMFDLCWLDTPAAAGGGAGDGEITLAPVTRG